MTTNIKEHTFKPTNAERAKIEKLSVDTMRCLAMDAVQKANSGHPGAPIALSPVAYTLWQQVMRYDPAHPSWANRDRFILSAGHASMLLYNLIHLTGIRSADGANDPSISLDDIKSFRQLGSPCAGHPEYGLAAGIETTTGPLGQGLANSVGMAVAARWQGAHFNRDGFDIVDHDIYAVCGDGCLMEGISSEAASLAGHLELSNLCWIYDSNQISIEGATSLAFSENIEQRFKSAGWRVEVVDNANDCAQITSALAAFKGEMAKPTLIIVNSQIAFGAPTKAGTAAAHGSPLGPEEIAGAKAAYGWNAAEDFSVPSDVYDDFKAGFGARGAAAYSDWQSMFVGYQTKHPELAAQFEQMQAGALPDDWSTKLMSEPALAPDKSEATRSSSGRMLNAVAAGVPWVMGGSADLAPSTKTLLKGEEDLSARCVSGRNMRFGVREHAMTAMLNGMALSKMRPFGAGFLIFSDYARNAIRLSSLMKLPVVHVFTHDSIAVGEDGPTHQPVEHLASLRAMPGLSVVRPADAEEARQAWQQAMTANGPTALILSRQNLKQVDHKIYTKPIVSRGGYIVADHDKAQAILIASGGELSLAIDAHEILAKEGVHTRVVSLPSWDLFAKQDQTYRDSVLPPKMIARVAIERGCSFGWERYTGTQGKIIAIDRYGDSAPGAVLDKHFGFTTEKLIEAVRDLLSGGRA